MLDAKMPEWDTKVDVFVRVKTDVDAGTIGTVQTINDEIAVEPSLWR